MHWTEYKITLTRPVSGVRPASVDKIVTLFMDPSSPNLEHSFPVSYRSKPFVCSSIESSIRACATILRLPILFVCISSSVCEDCDFSWENIVILLMKQKHCTSVCVEWQLYTNQLIVWTQTQQWRYQCYWLRVFFPDMSGVDEWY